MRACARALRLLTLTAIAAGSLACSSAKSPTRTAEGYETDVLRYENYPNTVSFPELAEDLGYLAPLKLEYLGNTIGGPQNMQSVVTGDTDFGGAFNGAVIKLIASKAPVKAVMAYYGSDEQTFVGYYVPEGSPIHSARDLIGKKVAVNTLGAHLEFALRDYLARGGLTSEEAQQVTLVVVPPINGEQSLRMGQVEVAALGQIFREKAIERGGLRLLFADTSLYGNFNAGSYVMSKRFLAEKPKAARKFVEAVGRAIEWSRSAPRAVVVKRMQDIVRRRGRDEDPQLLEYWKTPTVSSRNGRLSNQDYALWIDWLVKDGQLAPNQVTPESLYTNALQPTEVSSAEPARSLPGG